MNYDGARVLESSGHPIGDPNNEEADELSKRASVFGYQSEGMVVPECRLKYSVKTLWWSRKRATTYSQLRGPSNHTGGSVGARRTLSADTAGRQQIPESTWFENCGRNFAGHDT